MDWLVVEGVKPWDGRYEFDLQGQELTTREWGWIKRLSGYLPLTINEGFDGADPELFASFAAIALHRAGKVDVRQVPEVFERLQDAPFGATIRLETDTEAETEENPSQPSSNESESSSGDAGQTSSAISDATPSRTGMDGSATAVLPPARLAS